MKIFVINIITHSLSVFYKRLGKLSSGVVHSKPNQSNGQVEGQDKCMPSILAQ